jgi:intracellular sulfur oxidation DsrE/DsrF family protein
MPTVDSPMQDARAESKATGLVVHGAGQGAQDWLPGVLRSATNAADALPAGTAIEVVIQGPGVALLTGGSGFAEAIRAALERQISILACGNSLRSAAVPSDQLLPGVDTVPAAIAHLASRQWEGWAYVRL